MNDDPWDFGTSSQYPALSVDTNGVGGATWQEFGQQIRTSPALTPTTALGQVTLTWSAVSSAAYNLYRTSGTTVEILSENTSSRSYVDTDVTAGATYVYQVATVINGGEASRSPRVSVVVPTPGLMPSVTLQLMPTSISENGGSATVTARLSHTSGETTTVTVSATAVTPAVSGDFTLSIEQDADDRSRSGRQHGNRDDHRQQQWCGRSQQDGDGDGDGHQQRGGDGAIGR